jgi:hypothetical protein
VLQLIVNGYGQHIAVRFLAENLFTIRDRYVFAGWGGVS